jgi:dihydroorotate dehydrogenase (NAD+) catalytic subunit
LSTSLCGVALQNPIIPASGCFGFGQEFRAFYDLNCLGAIAIKGTTPKPRLGNSTPRVAECPAGMLNSVGLQNPGLEAVIQNELPRLAKICKQPNIANVSGFAVEEYVACCAAMSASALVSIVELNISCPNIHGGGLAFGADAKNAAKVTAACKAVCNKPLFVKLSPNVTNIAEIAEAVESAGADGISLINTLLGMRIDLKTRNPVLANKSGGYSGPGVFPVALHMIYQVYETVKIPIIGMGGVSSARDVIEMLLAGAAAVQIGAANLVNPYASKEIVETLPDELAAYGFLSVADCIGLAHS